MALLLGIVRSRIDRHPIVVVSAMGKTTNRLLEIASDAVKGNRADALTKLSALRAFHLKEADGLGVNNEIDAHFEELAELVRGLSVMGEMTPRATDAVSAYGERLSSIVVAAAFRQAGMKALHVDSREYVVTDTRHTQAAPLFDKTNAKLASLPKSEVVVMGGFIASTEEGVTSTLGRGGSDYTASIVGAGIGADEIQIWTDVDGMLTADPRVVRNPRVVPHLSFAEAAELAYFGAKVLHPSTILPAIERNIPVRILNSRNAEAPGTLITAAPPPNPRPLTGLACKRGLTVIDITSDRMLMVYGFLRRVFEVFERFRTAVDVVTTSEVSVSVTVDDRQHLDAIVAALSEFATVQVDGGMALLCAVGDRLPTEPAIAARAVGVLEEVPLEMISQAASRRNITVVLREADLERAMHRLHQEFFE